MIIGAAYLRCSDPRQDKSIEQQRAEIEKRATQDGVVIPADNWFVDEGISGKSTKRRASYLSLIRRAEAQKEANRTRKAGPRIARLYVWAFSRIARNMFDCLKAIATLDDADIEIVSLTENDTGDRSMRKLIRPILAWLAERYIEELSRNVQRGQMSQCSKGFWPHGHSAFGYESVKVEGGFKLMVTEKTRPDFEVVKRIFREADEGRDGARRIAERLTREGIKPPLPPGGDRRKFGPESWFSRHVHYILTNRIYCGHIVEKGTVMCRNAHEAAVDDETFDRIQAKRTLRFTWRQQGRGNGADYVRQSHRGLVRPWLRCGNCGGKMLVIMGGKEGARTYLYYCTTRTQNKALCPGISVRVERLDTLVMDAIERQVLSPENLQTLMRNTAEALAATDVDETAAERQRLIDQIAELDRKIRLTAAQVINGLIDEADAKVLSTPFLQQREAARLRLAALPAKQEMIDLDRVDLDAFRVNLLKAWKDRPVDEQREALSKVLHEVKVHPGGVHIEYSLGGYCEHDREGPLRRT